MVEVLVTDGGRSAAGFMTKSTKDEVVCALATLRDEPYAHWYKIVGMYNKRRGLKRADAPLKHDIPTILEVAGLTKVLLPANRWLTYSEAYENHGDCIVLGMARGVHCIKDGFLHAKRASALTRRTFFEDKVEYVERKTRNIWVQTQTRRVDPELIDILTR